MEPSKDPSEGQVEPESQEDAILAFLEEQGSLPVLDPESSEADHERAVADIQRRMGLSPKPRPSKEPARAPGKPADEAGERLTGEAEEAGEALEQTAREAGKALQDDSAYEKALSAMRRYKTPESVIEAMSPEEAIAWGAHLAKIQGDFDRANTDLRTLKQSAQQSDGVEKAEEATRQVEAPPAPDLDAVTTQAAELLGLSREEGGVLGKLFEAVTAPLKRELAERDTRDQLRDNAIAELLIERTRGRLEGRFPQLADDTVFKELVTKAIEQVKAGVADNLPSALADAARARFYDENQETVASRVNKEARVKARGSPGIPSPRSAPVALSHDERLDKVLDLLESGATGEEAARAAGW